jgi:hypothetical protein
VRTCFSPYQHPVFASTKGVISTPEKWFVASQKDWVNSCAQAETTKTVSSKMALQVLILCTHAIQVCTENTAHTHAHTHTHTHTHTGKCVGRRTFNDDSVYSGDMHAWMPHGYGGFYHLPPPAHYIPLPFLFPTSPLSPVLSTRLRAHTGRTQTHVCLSGCIELCVTCTCICACGCLYRNDGSA